MAFTFWIMKEIQLTRGYVAIIDDDDFKWLFGFKWHVQPKRNGRACAVRGIVGENGKRALEYMHRAILNAPKHFFVDHINGNALDNRKENLRLCTNAENLKNRGPQKNNKTGFKGVSKNSDGKTFIARIRCSGKQITIGYFASPEDAARAYDKEAIKLHGEFAWLNFRSTIGL